MRKQQQGSNAQDSVDLPNVLLARKKSLQA
jgi:hypothetical protein